MLKPIEQHIKQLMEEEGLDVPNLSQGAVQFLHVLFNYSTASRLNIFLEMKSQGYSDAHIAGFAAGMQYCSDTLDSALEQKAHAGRQEIQFD
ncbi:hypotetical phage protein [Citrobacter phage CR8]|uniref:Hypotetical phage protein n=1 Tax=Citrobacter phage CR8 TaxID=1455076 RepID=W6PUQ8_9CAUD|nr:hypotetical phage protein [Citrobacter phage CR8]EDW9662045.1 DUF2717 domain-containing protein [Salmonella enterica subsp. enterica serovar Newport]CDM21618.1 hypotetical phage protein [Citrobacter phage CR8]